MKSVEHRKGMRKPIKRRRQAPTADVAVELCREIVRKHERCGLTPPSDRAQNTGRRYAETNQ